MNNTSNPPTNTTNAAGARQAYLDEALKHIKKEATAIDPDRLSLIVLMLLAWPSATVSRSELSAFSGGVLHPRTIANKDAQHTGITPSFRCGRRIYYRTVDVAIYMLNQMATRRS